MFAIDYAFQTRRHIGIDALTNLFPHTYSDCAFGLMKYVFSDFSFVASGTVLTSLTTHNRVLPVTEISLAWLNSAVPTGCLLMVVTSLSFILQGCREKTAVVQEETC